LKGDVLAMATELDASPVVFARSFAGSSFITEHSPQRNSGANGTSKSELPNRNF
jgi:hypothetical protein